MQPNRKRLMMSFATGITLFSMILNILVPVPSTLAQETTPEPVVSTETPTQEPTTAATEPPPPTEAPTQEATAEVTAAPTEAVTQEVTSDPSATQEATETPTETPASLLFQDDFQDGNTEGWVLTPGWGLVQDGDNLFLSTGTPGEIATITTTAPADFALSARVRVTPGNKAYVAFRAGAENYTLTLDLIGNLATLNRGETQLGQTALTPLPADANGVIPAAWQTINIVAQGGSLTVTVDGLYVANNVVDATPLPAGAIIFSTDAANTGKVEIDQIVITSTPAVLTPVPIPTIETTATAEVTPDLTPELTPEATTEPEVIPEPSENVVLSADFEGELVGWLVGDGATIEAENDTNHVLKLASGAPLLPAADVFLADFRLDARLNILDDAADGTASGVSIPFRTQEGRSYVVSVEAGRSALYRNDGEGVVEIASSATAHPLNTWHTFSLSAVGGQIIITINDVVEIDHFEESPLVSGQISFVANAASNVWLDDLAVVDLNVTQLSLTPEPFGLGEAERAKLPTVLLDILDLVNSGDEAGALAKAQAEFVPLDEQNRVSVVLWATEPQMGPMLAELVTTVGGVANYIYEDNVEAHVPFTALMPLVNAPQVYQITLVSHATSTSSTVAAPAFDVMSAAAGVVVGEGFDIVSANDWHQAGLTGATKKIGLIDTGFVGAVDAGEYSCMVGGNPGGSGSHGAQVLQVLCDIAPNAAVSLYAASDVSTLNARLTTAATANDIVLITMDLGVDVSPGDGTGGAASSAATTLYNNIQTRRNAGKLIIVSAGNNNWWASDSFYGDPFPDNHRIGRYFSMNYNNGGGGIITIPVIVKQGDTIRINWNDWDRSIPNRPNFDVTLEPVAVTAPDQTITPLAAPIRNATGALAATVDPALNYKVGTNCPTGEMCYAALKIGGANADGSHGEGGPVYFQVQISGAGLIDADGPITGATVDFNSGNIARPADSSFALTVGAVCARPGEDYPRLRDSSVGPIFAVGGSGPDTLSSPPVRSDYKPDLVAPSDVSVAGNALLSLSKDSCYDGSATPGFSGTSAAAAYVAGMAALIQQNANANVRPGPSWDAQETIDYLQSHSIDLPKIDINVGDSANGFDMIYGAGLPVLGDPVPTAPINPPAPGVGIPSDGTCPGGIKYVRPGNVGSANLTPGALGTFENPFVHVAQAVDNASANSCVILFPGEYVSGLYVDNSIASGIKLRSYKRYFASADDSVYWTNNSLNKGEGGIVIYNNSMSVDGFVFTQSDPADKCDTNPAPFDPFSRPVALVVDSSAGGNVISNNIIAGFKGFGPEGQTAACFTNNRPGNPPVKVLLSNGVTLQNNTFMNNDAQGGAALRLEDSADGAPNIVQSNVFKDNDSSAPDLSSFNSTIFIQADAVNLYNNRFTGNNTRTILNIDDGSNPEGDGEGQALDLSGPPVFMFGNIFTQNTNRGPVIRLFPGREFSFINNTVARNRAFDGGAYSGIIVRGQGAETFSGTGGNGLFNIHNNIFYDNSSESLVKDQGGNFTCVSVEDGPENGAQNNWAFGSGSLLGVCQNPFAGFNNNINVTDPGDPFTNPDISQFVGPEVGGDDPYQIKGNSFAIGNANEALVPDALENGLDPVGNPRKSGTDGLDIGAYEYKAVTPSTPTLPCLPTETCPPLPTTFPEDFIYTGEPKIDINPTLAGVQDPTTPLIRIKLNAEGGFKPYTFELVTAPLNYSTDPNNLCGGLPAYFNQLTNEVYYCPPRHFYNQGLGAPAAVSFQYRVRDNAGNPSDPATINLTITPTNDTNLSTPLGTVEQPYTIVGVVAENPVPITFRLRPYARFGNFRISAPGDATLPAAEDGDPDALQADYPYTYSNISFPEGDNVCAPGENFNLFGAGCSGSQQAIRNAFNDIGANGGVLLITPAEGQTGFMDFIYTSRDARNNTVNNNRVRLLVVGDLPDSGLHDDTSFTFNYFGVDETKPGTWLPIYNEATINNTLHTTTVLNDTSEFLFDGVGFSLYMQGSSAGGLYELKVENAGIPTPLQWSPVTGVVGVLEATNGTVRCRTSATPGGAAVAGKYALLSNLNANLPYVVSCSGFLDGEANKVSVINKQAGRNVSIDAIGILQNGTPLLPGVHEVTESQLLPTFFGWTQSRETLAVGQRAVYTSDPTNDIRFTFQGGTGFALGTALQRTALAVPANSPLGVQYRVCFADVTAPDKRTCQRFDNGLGATTALLWKVFRPFYGFDPDNTYEVTVDITGVPTYSGVGAKAIPMKFYIDSIVIFDTLNQPTSVLPIGVTEDDVIGPITYSNGLPDAWVFNSNLATASNRSLTSVVAAMPKVGPFISFTIPADADTFNWFLNGTVNTTKALICVDRPALTTVGSDMGNCIIMNTRTGTYEQISASGVIGPDTTPVTGSKNPILVTQDMFRAPWGTSAPHTIEISSLTNETFNLDKIQVISSSTALTAGYYEESTPNLKWFTETDDLVDPQANNGPYPFDSDPDAHFTDLVNRLASGGSVKILYSDNALGGTNDYRNLYEGMFFRFTGTGFTTYFTLDPKADAVRICWKPAGTDVADILATGTCQTFDNQSTAIRYKAGRTIAGLPLNTYGVVVQMLADQGEPKPHVGVNTLLTMQIDAVEIHNHTIPNVLNASPNRYETSFVNQAAQGNFAYVGTGWRSVSTTAARLYSGNNYDNILNVIGAGVVFRTNGGANVVIYRDTRAGTAPMQVCINRVSDGSRRCTIHLNNGAAGGNQQPLSVPLFDATAYTVTVMTTDAGNFFLDAVMVTNTPLQPGIYDENDPALVYSTTSDPEKPIYSHWQDVTSTLFTDRGAMQSTTAGASVTFDFVGTGFSFITLLDRLSSSVIDIEVVGINGEFEFTVSNNQAAVAYGASHSFTGLPQDTYTVTITEAAPTTPATTPHKLVVDGIEVYGFTGDASGYDPAKELQPGFYDNAALNANGQPYLTFGPNNATWTTKTGTLAPLSFNQTNQQTNRVGGVVTFEVQNANAITLYHSGATSTAVQVCALQVGTFTRTCETQTLVGKNNTTFTAPFAGAGNYYVSITNLSHARILLVDAIAVQNTAGALAEGLYEERNPALTFNGGPGVWGAAPIANAYATDKLVRATTVGAASGQELNFSFNGTGFSIILVEGSTTTSGTYTLCVGVGGNCSIIPVTPLTRSNTTAAQRPIALTYVGFTPGTYTVKLTNTDATKPLLVDRVDVLGALTVDERIDDIVTGNVENTDPRITYFPFFSYKPLASTLASGGSQHTGTIQGSVAYFEIENAAGTLDFEYVRQTLTTYGNVQVCSGALGDEYGTGVTCTDNINSANPIANNALPAGYQKPEAVSIDGTGVRWVILRNDNGKIMPLDFIRPTIAGAPLTAGAYEETHPNVRWFTEQDEPVDPQLPNGPYTLLDSGEFGNFTNLVSAASSGGTVRVLNEDFDPALPASNDKLNLYEGMAFQFNGTGFSVNFILDSKADAVKICWTNDGNAPVALNSAKVTAVLGAPTCQIYDNQSAIIRYRAGRTIVGLTKNYYTVAVQMLDDNGQPATHTAATSPLRMQIDGVQVYDDTLPPNVLNTAGQRYETSFVNRAADGRFLYYGAGWKSFSGTAARLYSGSDYDLTTGIVGAGIAFRTNNANSIILYRSTRAGYTPLQVCATPTAAPTNRQCQIVENHLGVGNQQPVSIIFNTGSTAEHIVTITTMDAGAFYLDAIQVVNTNAPLTAGYYEDTSARLIFTDLTPGVTNDGNGNWVELVSAGYSGGRARQTNVTGANAGVLEFTFTGTGFQVGMGIDRWGGEVRVCYDNNLDFSSPECFVYQNESVAASNLVSRTVAGLQSGTYKVRVTHADDGNQIIAPVGPRVATYSPSRLRIDYVQIFDNAVPTVTQSGLYNEDAKDSNGDPYLQLFPADRWNTFSGASLGRGFSNLSYVGVVDNAKRLSALYAGPTAALRVQVPAGGATVVLYTGTAITTNTASLLVCANNVGAPAPQAPPPVPPPPLADTINLSNERQPGTNCTVINTMKTSNQIVLNSTKLDALGNAGPVTLTFRALTPGLFRIDGFQVIQGNTLTPGIYDDFLFGVDGLIDLNAVGTTAGTWTVAPTVGTKLAAAYGTTQVLAQSTGLSTADDPTLTFKFQGTGFSIITTADSVGVDMQICYTLTANVANNNIYDPGTTGTICDTVTTDTNTTVADWTDKNGNQPKPSIAYQYGFTFYNLRPNAYTVGVKLVDTVMVATDRLKIDAIAIFSDIEVGGPVLTSAPNGQLYDNTHPGLRYEPAPFWTSATTATGPLTGPWNRTQHTATNAGAIVQMNVNGNGIVLYQTAATGSRFIKVCVRTHLGQECTEYSQYAGRATYFSPIAFYGFGSGNHQVVIENREHGRILSIDGVRAIP